MTHVLTLITSPGTGALDESLVDRVRTGLEGAGVGPGAPDWLAGGIACDLPLGEGSTDVAARAAREAIGDAPVDLAVQKAATRAKRLLIADMDSTMIEVECIDEIAEAAGVRDKVAEITERAMRGELEFEAALAERVGLLQGLDEARLGEIYETRVTYTPGAAALVGTMRARGAFTALVSGGFSFFADKVRDRLGFHWSQANDLEIGADGRLTGKVLRPVLGETSKSHALQAICAQQEIPLSQAMAVGDGANDLAMVRMAGTGVAYHAKPKLAQAAEIRIFHADLTALLYLQGYRREEFVEEV